ncbi:DNA alkylation repair protein [Velocimicrobium porci]|uniref:DNA alkylation repair protein n=1 Tax=Velocimicrobium porci TaxID=2606634 RepID=A0A6L5XZP8_9FIRM|nr:DNA alkylation repair protein [Velocimicrobium porci]MSS64194.1 DNA alkylation repair protein [Velocimicrobium porci]
MEWTKERYHKEIRVCLNQLSEQKYQRFSSKLLPGTENILGVRFPKLRSLAKTIAKDDWKTYLQVAQDDTFEEIMLQGMVIGSVKAELEELIPYMREFIDKIDNWSVCDSFCSSLKRTAKEKEQMWEFLQEYFHSEREYDLRFAVVMFLNYYVEKEYLQIGFGYFDKINREKYYVKMAVAWAISICYIKYQNETIVYLEHCKLDIDTYNKALQKIIESTRVAKEEKQKIRMMKR